MTTRQRLWGTAAVGGLGGLLVLAFTVWHLVIVPAVEAAITRAVGHRTIVGTLRPGWRAMEMRDVVVFGAAPFDSAALARIERMRVRFGGPGFGLWSPSAVIVNRVQITYLRSGTVDNVGSAPPGSDSSSGSTARNRRPVLVVHDGRLDGFIRLEKARSLTLRGERLSLERDVGGTLAAHLGGLSLELVGAATLTVPQLQVTSRGGRQAVSLSANDVRVTIPAGGILLDRLQIAGDLERGTLSATVNRTPGRAGDNSGAFRVRAFRSDRETNLDLKIERLPLAPLRPLLRKIGIDSGETVASLDLQASRLRSDAAAGGAFQIHFDGHVDGLDIHDPRLDRQPWSGLNMGAQGEAVVKVAGPAVERLEISKARATLLGATVEMNGWADARPTVRGAWHLEIPRTTPADCESLLPAQAPPVRRALRGLQLAGHLGLDVDLSYDAAAWDELGLDVEIAPRCRVLREPDVLEDLLPTLLGRARRPHPWRELPLDAHQPGFVPIARMPKHLVDAFMTAEDGRFRTHAGFDLEMIRRALAHDLEMGGIAKGASTITQQLAKNLFLDPERTLGRKLEELVIAWRLHERLAKQKQLELYLNVIELGPDIRGVGRAAEAYFGKPVSALGPLESAHLASLTPNPIGYARRFRDGRVDDGWLNHLYDLLGMMNRSGRLSATELLAARNSRLVLRRP